MLWSEDALVWGHGGLKTFWLNKVLVCGHSDLKDPWFRDSLPPLIG